MERLSLILKGNAVFSALSGALLLGGSGTWQATLGLETWFLAVAGIALTSYGGLLRWLAGRPDVAAGALFATIMDVVWVAGTAVVLIGFPTAMTGTGRVFLVAVSLVVAGFAEAQFLGLRRASGREPSVVAVH